MSLEKVNLVLKVKSITLSFTYLSISKFAAGTHQSFKFSNTFYRTLSIVFGVSLYFGSTMSISKIIHVNQVLLHNIYVSCKSKLRYALDGLFASLNIR